MAQQDPQAAGSSQSLHALRQRGVVGMLHSAQINETSMFWFWRGFTKALSDAIDGAGQPLAAIDAPSGYEPPAYLKAAWAALPERVETLGIADVQQLLAAQGVEVASDPVTDHSKAASWDRVERLQAFLAQHAPLDVAQLPSVDITKMETVLVWACKMFWRLEDRRANHWRECPDLHFTAGAQNTLHLLLQQLGVIPVGPFGRSVQELLHRLAAVRHQQPEAFEHLAVAQAFEWFRQHGIELTLDEVPGLQLYLAAGRKHEGVPAPILASAKADQKDLSVGADALNGAGVHVSTPKSNILAQEGGAA